jgi:prolipoprotein diacylglyceryltransferase
MLPILNIGPLAIQTPGLLLLIGLWLGLTAAEKHAPFYQLTQNLVYNITLFSLLAGIIGARLGYVAQFPTAFSDDPLSLVSPNLALFDVYTGIVIAFLTALVYIGRKKIPFWQMMDGLVSLFGILLIARAAAQLASGDGFGMPAQIPWSIDLWGEKRHPVQVYEILLTTLIYILILPEGFLLKNTSSGQPGTRFWVFLALSAGAQLFLEAFRGDSLLIINSIRLIQVISWLVLAAGLWQVYLHIRVGAKGKD